MPKGVVLYVLFTQKTSGTQYPKSYRKFGQNCHTKMDGNFDCWNFYEGCGNYENQHKETKLVVA